MMYLTDKHPAELDFHQMIKEVKTLLEKCKNHFLDGEERKYLNKELGTIKQKLFDLQMKRFSQYINDRGKVENMPENEEKIQREMTELQQRVDYLIQS